jgi:anti-sigma regulatory factor (Ser/Thr protein kinase)
MPETRTGLTLDNVAAFPVTLPNSSSSAKAARRLLRTALRGAIADDVIDDLELMVSELVANAVANGVGPCCLAMTLPRPGVLRIEVSDQNRGRPSMPPADVAADSGRGLQLIASLATRWGHHGGAGEGNTVWIEVVD